MLESTLLGDITGDGLVFWAGMRRPSAGIHCSRALFDDTGDFRLAPCEHGRYRTVYLVEYDLGHHKQWPLIVDEALRLFEYGKQGTLFVRFSQSDLLSAFAFAAFLRRRSDFTFELAYQDAFESGTILYCIRCQREASQPGLSSMEFAVITDGKRPGAVAHFIASVAAIRGIDLIDWSIAVCGPAQADAKLAHTDGRIRYIEAPIAHAGQGWITRKKNLIVDTSHADNLLIAHDRYGLPTEFLEQLFEFGADFSVVVPRQVDRHGEPFPDWVTIGSQWTRTGAAMLEYGDYSPHGYVNGGVIIAKRQVLARTAWNELLFWGQYEDVELSRALAAAGVTPRLARSVQLRVTAARPGYTRDFERLPYLPQHYAVPRFGAHLTDKVAPEFAFGHSFAFGGRMTFEQMAEAGIVGARQDWTCSAAGLVLAERTARLAVTVPARGQRSAVLSVVIPAYADAPYLTIHANGTALQLRWLESAPGLRCARAQLDHVLGRHERTLALTFSTDTDAVVLKALEVAAHDVGAGSAQ